MNKKIFLLLVALAVAIIAYNVLSDDTDIPGLISDYENQVSELSEKIRESDIRYNQLKSEYQKVKSEYQQLSEKSATAKVKLESSVKRIKPEEKEKCPGLKVALDYCLDLSGRYESEIANLIIQGGISDSMVIELQTRAGYLEEIIERKSKINEEYRKLLLREKRKRKVIIVVSVAAILAALVIS